MNNNTVSKIVIICQLLYRYSICIEAKPIVIMNEQ